MEFSNTLRDGISIPTKLSIGKTNTGIKKKKKKKIQVILCITQPSRSW